MISGSVGLVNLDRFWEALEKAQRNEDVSIGMLKRTLTLESWLRHLTIQEILTNSPSTKSRDKPSSLESQEFPARAQPKGLAS